MVPERAVSRQATSYPTTTRRTVLDQNSPSRPLGVASLVQNFFEEMRERLGNGRKGDPLKHQQTLALEDFDLLQRHATSARSTPQCWRKTSC